jgi:hypothetical protein
MSEELARKPGWYVVRFAGGEGFFDFFDALDREINGPVPNGVP